MRNQGYRPMPIEGAVKSLKAIARTADLLNPEAVKEAIAKRPVSDGQKEKIVTEIDGARLFRKRR